MGVEVAALVAQDAMSNDAQIMHNAVVWMKNLARRGAQLRLTRPKMREGFSLSSAPRTISNGRA
jgi:hypothetical protein